MNLSGTFPKQFELNYIYQLASTVESYIESGAPFNFSDLMPAEKFQLSALKFQKTTLLHLFIEQVILNHYEFFFTWRNTDLEEDLDTLATLESLFLSHRIKVNFLKLKYDPDYEDEMYLLTDNKAAGQWYLKNKKKFKLLAGKVVPAVFHILFSNRAILHSFNKNISWQFSYFTFSSEQLTQSGTIERTNFPKWLRRAIFFRDQGICSICAKDLKGIINTLTVEHFDHIIPLAKHGVNDPTNIQLLCVECNIRKGDRNMEVGTWYQSRGRILLVQYIILFFY